MPNSTPTRHQSVAESWQWLEAALDGRPLPTLLIVIGLGDGSLLDALEERAPATRVLALEPDPAAARTFFAKRRESAWRTNGRLVYLTDPGYAGADEAWRIFKPNEEPKVLIHPSAGRAPGTARATEVLTKILSGVKANAQARRRFAPRYLTNVLRNVPAIMSGGDVRSLANLYRGMPAVIAAAGPSLDDALAELHGAVQRGLLIACDTALRPLLHAGLAPPLVVGADPSALNARHFHSLPDCPSTHLVAESALDPTAAAAFPGRTFWFRLAPHQPWPWLKSHELDVGLVEMWGSVLTAAFQVACLAGCDPIVIVGADLAHSGGRPYARTTTYELDWAHAVARGETPDETWRGHIAGTRPIERPDVRGVTTTTTPTMLAFRDWLVARSKRSGRRVINATGAGMLFGDGIEQGTIAQALASARPSTLPDLTLHMSRTASAEPARILQRLREVRGAVGTASSPVTEWMAFTEGGLDEPTLAAALEDAIAAFESSQRDIARVSVIPYASLFAFPGPRAVFRELPEAIERLKAGMRQHPLADSPKEPGALLVHALEVLAAVIEQTSRSNDLVCCADPERIGKVPASALYPWPEAARWAVVAFEALLGRAWGNVVREVPAFSAVVEEASKSATSSEVVRHPRFTHACLVLAIEWLRCAASVDVTAEPILLSAADRLATLEAALRPEPGHVTTTFAGLVRIEAEADDRACALDLPVPLSGPMVGTATLGLAGTDANQHLLAGVAIDGYRVRVSLVTSVARTL